MALLEVRGVDAGYGHGPDILRGLSLEIEAGTSYCIIGPNGAGKSTLLRVISGLLPPRSGEVAFKGVPFNGARPDQVLATGICFVPQDQAVFPEMSVRENLVVGAYLVRDRSLIKERMDRVFELFPILAERESLDAGKLSGGQQQMLTLGRALMIDPEVMMLDEPSLGLAPQIAEQIFATIRALKDLGITIVMVEQNAVRGLELADWGVVLDLGIVRFEGPADTILKDPRIRELYLGKAANLEETP
ncbi:MAG: ABC transporter ATP-binding protein [Acidimicrobiia bacterium]|nr:MAG: ABC transporter ATP-binding protein [Acidimicrobiia bacterium]